MNCQHTRTESGRDYGFRGAIPDAEENPAAHGCITYTETCLSCGARRGINQNQCHVEIGPWHLPGKQDQDFRRFDLQCAPGTRVLVHDRVCRYGSHPSARVGIQLPGDSTVRWSTWREMERAAIDWHGDRSSAGLIYQGAYQCMLDAAGGRQDY